MRIRTVKPEFWRSTGISQLPRELRLLFIGLWSYVDDNGVGVDDHRQVAADLFPLDDDPVEAREFVREGLARLSRDLLIERYEVAGRSYLFIRTWDRHQKVDKPNKPRHPRPSALTSADDSGATSSRESREGLAPVTEEQRNRGTEEPAPTELALVPHADPPPAELTTNQRAQALARAYTEVVPLSKFPAILGISKKAIQTGHDDEAIRAALLRLAADNRPVTIDSLRIELGGNRPPGKRTASERAARTLALMTAEPEQTGTDG